MLALVLKSYGVISKRISHYAVIGVSVVILAIFLVTPDEVKVKPYDTSCVTKGMEYYKSIGSYPRLSTGEDAYGKIMKMCDRSGGSAF